MFDMVHFHLMFFGIKNPLNLCKFMNHIGTHFMLLQVSNRRSRRWLNDRLLMELVPRLDADEIRGLFAPPPWGNFLP